MLQKGQMFSTTRKQGNGLVNHSSRSLPRTELVPGSASDWRGWSWDAQSLCNLTLPMVSVQKAWTVDKKQTPGQIAQTEACSGVFT